MAEPVILDCDTGSDDAVAIMLAALHPDLDLLGVTTVWGNHDVAHTTDNTLRVLDLVGRGDVAVHPGRNAPVRPRISQLPSGRADLPPTLDLPAPVSRPSSPAVEWLVATLRATTRPVALVPTGPLTNIAAAVAADPRIVEAVGRLVVLGGSHRQPGVTPYAERNVWCDPHAAADVFAAGFRDLLLVTMDATFSVPLTAADADRLRSAGSRAGRAAADLLEVRIGLGAPLHDPLAVACLLDPDVVAARPAAVSVELRDEERYAATRLDLASPAPTLRVALAADRQRYLRLLEAALGS